MPLAPMRADGWRCADLVWDFTGNAIAPREVAVCRTVWAEAPAAPRARLCYSCGPADASDGARDAPGVGQERRIPEHLQGLAHGGAASFIAVRAAGLRTFR